MPAGPILTRPSLRRTPEPRWSLTQCTDRFTAGEARLPNATTSGRLLPRRQHRRKLDIDLHQAHETWSQPNCTCSCEPPTVTVGVTSALASGIPEAVAPVAGGIADTDAGH